jgi:hypothetical protein
LHHALSPNSPAQRWRTRSRLWRWETSKRLDRYRTPSATARRLRDGRPLSSKCFAAQWHFDGVDPVRGQNGDKIEQPQLALAGHYPFEHRFLVIARETRHARRVANLDIVDQIWIERGDVGRRGARPDHVHRVDQQPEFGASHLTYSLKRGRQVTHSQ